MSSDPLFNKITIVGVGLIGGSLGLSINQRGLAGEIIGIGRNLDKMKLALEFGAVHKIEQDFSAAAGSDLIIIATPVGSTLSILSGLIPFVAPGTIITDVGSTKATIMASTKSLMPTGSVFIGGHPMAGSEKDGITGADPYLFENAFYVLTPERGTSPESVDRMIRLVKGIGARPILMEPMEHDLSVAAVSHLPHLVAATLVNSLFDLPGSEKISLLAAGGFRDTTRIASGNPDMWRDIFKTNRHQILQALSVFKSRIDEFQTALENEDQHEIYNLLNRAKLLKAGLPAKTKGYLPALWEIVVTVPDRPGVIAQLAKILGNAGINIADIEILRVREGEGGTIRIAFAGGEEQEKAIILLSKSGIPVIKRP